MAFVLKAPGRAGPEAAGQALRGPLVSIAIDDSDLAAQVELLCAAAGLRFTANSGALGVTLTITDGPVGDLVVYPDGRPPPAVDLESVSLPSGSQRLSTILAEIAQPTSAVSVGVLGCAGGVGASTLTIALARAAPSGAAAIDLDGAGPGWDALLGTEAIPGGRWGDLTGVGSPLVGTDLTTLLPAWRGVSLLGRSIADLGAPPDRVARWLLQAAQSQYSLLAVDFGRCVRLVSNLDALLLVAPTTLAGRLQAERARELCPRVARVGVVWVGPLRVDLGSAETVARTSRVGGRGDWHSRAVGRDVASLGRRCLSWVLS